MRFACERTKLNRKSKFIVETELLIKRPKKQTHQTKIMQAKLDSIRASQHVGTTTMQYIYLKYMKNCSKRIARS